MERTNTKRPRIAILACDPSIRGWGYSVICNEQIIEVGCIKTEPKAKKLRTRKGDDNVRRFEEIDQKLLEIIKRNDIKYIVSELPHGSQSASAAYMLGAATAIMKTIADCNDIGLEWFSEGDSKKQVLGKLSAEKKEMVRAISKLYKVPWTGVQYIDEAIADSLGVYHAAKNQSSALKLIK